MGNPVQQEILEMLAERVKHLIFSHMVEFFTELLQLSSLRFAELLDALRIYASIQYSQEEEAAIKTNGKFKKNYSWKILEESLLAAAKEAEKLSPQQEEHQKSLSMEIIKTLSIHARQISLIEMVAELTHYMEQDRIPFSQLLLAIQHYAEAKRDQSPEMSHIWSAVAESLAQAVVTADRGSDELP